VFVVWLWPFALCDMALFYLLLFRYCFGVAWGVTVSLGNSSTVSVTYQKLHHNVSGVQNNDLADDNALSGQHNGLGNNNIQRTA
jgi:hypothetical protein